MKPFEMRGLVDLPVELLDSVFDFVVRPSDLKALCLVSKAISEPAFRHLYRTITLPYSSHDRNWTRLENLSQSQHLYHIQSIDIGQSDLPRNHLFCKRLQPLLQKLPRGALKSFTYGLHGRPQAEDLITIWRDHKNLRKLQLDLNLYAPSLREMVLDLREDLRSLTSVEELEVDFGQEQDEALSLALFDSLYFEKLRSIKLQYVGIEDYMKVELPHGIGTLGSTLVSRHFPRTLTSISLAFVCLPPPEEWQLSEYHALSTLELHECSNVAPILDSMKQPKLRHFHIQRRAETNDASTYLSTRRFLKRFGSLETLTININVEIDNGEQLVPVIREHGLHLKSLRVHGYSEEPGPLVLHDNLETYPQLRYLALPLRVDVMMVERCKRILLQLPQLEVLVVYQSSFSEAELSAWHDEDSKLRHAGECATKIFSQVPYRGKLRLLVFSKILDPIDVQVESEVTSFGAQAWRYCFIQAKDVMAYGGCSSACSVLEHEGLRAEIHAPVRLKTELAKYMFPGVGARILV